MRGKNMYLINKKIILFFATIPYDFFFVSNFLSILSILFIIFFIFFIIYSKWLEHIRKCINIEESLQELV